MEEFLQAALQLPAYDLSPKAGGREKLAPNTYLQSYCVPQTLP